MANTLDLCQMYPVLFLSSYVLPFQHWCPWPHNISGLFSTVIDQNFKGRKINKNNLFSISNFLKFLIHISGSQVNDVSSMYYWKHENVFD